MRISRRQVIPAAAIVAGITVGFVFPGVAFADTGDESSTTTSSSSTSTDASVAPEETTSSEEATPIEETTPSEETTPAEETSEETEEVSDEKAVEEAPEDTLSKEAPAILSVMATPVLGDGVRNVSSVTVREDNLQAWVEWNRPYGADVNGRATVDWTLSGVQSTNAINDSQYTLLYPINKRLDSIDSLSFAVSGNATYQLRTSNWADGGPGSLVWERVYNPSTGVYDGYWWRTGAALGVPNGVNSATPYETRHQVTLTQILAANPDLFVGEYGISHGSYQPGTNVTDWIEFDGLTTYFRPALMKITAPTIVDRCEVVNDGGSATYGTIDGGTWKTASVVTMPDGSIRHRVVATPDADHVTPAPGPGDTYTIVDGKAVWLLYTTNVPCPFAVFTAPVLTDNIGVDNDFVTYGVSTDGTWKIGSVTTLSNGDIRHRVVFTPNVDYVVPAPGPGDDYIIVDGKAVWKLIATDNAIIVEATATISSGECYYSTDQGYSFRPIFLTFDNTGSNVPVEFVVGYFGDLGRTVPAGESVTVRAQDGWENGVGYSVTAGGETFDLSVPAFDCKPVIDDPDDSVDPVVSTPVVNASANDSGGVATDEAPDGSDNGDNITGVPLMLLLAGLATAVIVIIRRRVLAQHPTV